MRTDCVSALEKKGSLKTIPGQGASGGPLSEGRIKAKT